MPSFLTGAVGALTAPFAYPFMVNAFAAGTVVAVVAGTIGWFMVLRRQSFAGHTLALVGFPGAAGATLVGVNVAFGYFGFCVAAAMVIALLPGMGNAARSEESAVTGTVQAFALACGFLFVSLYKGFLNGIDALLFGSLLGITHGQVLALLAVGAATLVALTVVGRPLLFASLDSQVAAARGVPVRTLSVVFLLLLGAAVAEAAQITGALLVFALLVAPPATAQLLTGRPGFGIAASVGVGLLITWAGLFIAYWTPLPIGFVITTLAFAVYVVVKLADVAASRRGLTREEPR